MNERLQFRCVDCDKFFNYGNALHYLDLNYNLDKWREIRYIRENIQIFRRSKKHKGDKIIWEGVQLPEFFKKYSNF